MKDNIDLALGDRVEMRKPHPCGSVIWCVIRVGADIKLKCETCGRILMLERAKCAKSVRRVLPGGPDAKA